MISLDRFGLAAIALTVPLFLALAARAQEGVPAVPYTQIPEIKAYIQQDGMELEPDDVTVAMVDLNNPADGTPEYIINYHSTMFCGSAGCTTDVVRIGPSGKVEQLAGILSYGFSLAYTFTNGMRDLLSTGRSGEFIWRFDGKEYQPHKGHPKAAKTKPSNWTPPKIYTPDANAAPQNSIQGEKASEVTAKPKTSSDPETGIPTGLKDWWPWREAEAIMPYLEKKNRESPLGDTKVAMVDLSRPPNGKPNYIVEYDGPGYCKSEGCLREVIGFHFNDPPEAIAGVFGLRLRLGDTSTNKMADLITETAHGDVVWGFDGQRYVKVLDPRPESLGGTGGKRIELANKGPRRHKPYTGVAPRAPGCIGEYGWRRGYERGRVRRGYAVFGHCTDPENMIIRFTCRSDQAGVEADLQIDPEKAGPVKIIIQVDKDGYLIDANTQYVEMFGYNVPTFKLSPRSQLLNALARGQLARFIVGQKRVKIHLKGAAKAINIMRRACRG